MNKIDNINIAGVEYNIDGIISVNINQIDSMYNPTDQGVYKIVHDNKSVGILFINNIVPTISGGPSYVTQMYTGPYKLTYTANIGYIGSFQDQALGLNDHINIQTRHYITNAGQWSAWKYNTDDILDRLDEHNEDITDLLSSSDECQSDINDLYKKIDGYLNNGTFVPGVAKSVELDSITVYPDNNGKINLTGIIEDGKSTYQIWLELGHQGSEYDFLEWLNGCGFETKAVQTLPTGDDIDQHTIYAVPDTTSNPEIWAEWVRNEQNNDWVQLATHDGSGLSGALDDIDELKEEVEKITSTGLSDILFIGRSEVGNPKILFTSENVNEGDVVYYQISSPNNNNWNIRLYNENDEQISGGASKQNLNVGEVCKGSFVIPEGFSYAKSTWSRVDVKLAKKETLLGDSISQSLLEDRFQTVESTVAESDLANIGKIICNKYIGWNNEIFTHDDVSAGDTIYYEVIPVSELWNFKFYYSNGNSPTDEVLMTNAVDGETYYGKLIIPEGFDYAKNTRNAFRNCKIAKAGTLVGDSIAQYLIGEKLEKAEDIIEKSDLASIGNLLCNGVVNYNGVYFSNDDINEGDEIFYELTPRGGEFSIKIQYTNGEPETTIISTGDATAGETYRGKFVIPSNFRLAKLTRGNLKYCKMAKAGTIGGDSIAQAIIEEELESIKDDSNLPSYYKNYLDEKEAEIRNLQLNIQGEEDSFIFITDTHWINNYKQSPAIIESLLKRGLTDKVVFGGDLMGLHSSIDGEIEEGVKQSSYYESLELIKTQIDFHRKFAASVSACGAKLFNVLGNHDINGYVVTKATQEGDTTKYNALSEYFWRANKNATKNILVGSIVEKNEFYYAFDNAANKMRYIFLGGSDVMGIYDNLFYGEQWLISTLSSTPSNFDVIVFCHYGATVTTLKPYIPKVDEILTAFNKRLSGTVTIGNAPYNFTSIVGNGKVIAYFSGHTHRNLQNFSAGVAHICTACDASYSENPYLNEKPYSRGLGSTNEQLFDFVQIDKSGSMIYCKRIGSGYDRYFHTQSNTVTNGDSITLQPIMLSGELTWGAYDNNCDKSSKADKTDQNPVTPTRVSVLNGVVTGAAAGEAVVYAMDADGNREFFDVIVE